MEGIVTQGAALEGRFDARTEGLLAVAERLCGRRRARLTEIRRQVLGLLLESEAPVGAYDLLERLRPMHPGAVPPTVYRALEFLLAQGLVHKVERLSAFVGCVHGLEHEEAHLHVAQFLICRRCGRAIEFDDAEIEQALLRAAGRRGFALGGSTIEAEGVCAACTADAIAATPA